MLLFSSGWRGEGEQELRLEEGISNNNQTPRNLHLWKLP